MRYKVRVRRRLARNGRGKDWEQDRGRERGNGRNPHKVGEEERGMPSAVHDVYFLLSPRR